MTIDFAFTDNFFASQNHCSVKKGSIIELDLSPKGTLFLIISSLTKSCNSFNFSNIFCLASNLSNPIYSFGALSLIFPSSFNMFIDFNFCLFPTSKSLKSCAGVILTAPVPCSGSAYSS